MPEALFRNYQSRTLVLNEDNIDTDQIIPARFLTTTSKTGLGKSVFYDWRYDSQGQVKPDEPLNTVDTSQFAILVTGHNFGCGSSREHAPWALLDFGIKVVISTEIADIFRSNASKNGLLPIVAPAKAQTWLMANPEALLTIDLEEQAVHPENGPKFHFDIDPFAKHCLLQGIDPLRFLLNQSETITAFEKSRHL